jgi:hypothetical protein
LCKMYLSLRPVSWSEASLCSIHNSINEASLNSRLNYASLSKLAQRMLLQ